MKVKDAMRTFQVLINKALPVFFLLSLMVVVTGCPPSYDPDLRIELSSKQVVDGQSFRAKAYCGDNESDITSIQWYINGQLSSQITNNQAPLIRLTSGWPEGTYEIKAIATCTNGDDVKECSATETFEVIKSDILVLVRMKGPDPYAAGNVVKVGDEFECEIVLDKENSTKDVNLVRVIFSIDGKEVADVKQSPFVFKKTFTKSEVGVHTLTYHTYYQGELKTDVSESITFEVIE